MICQPDFWGTKLNCPLFAEPKLDTARPIHLFFSIWHAAGNIGDIRPGLNFDKNADKRDLKILP